MSAQLQVTGEAKIRDLQGPVVANSGVITALDGAASQYVRGDGTLADFPTQTGGGSSVSYYLNGSVNQGTFGGSTYYQMSKNAITGTGTNFSTSADGLLAQFITDANDPDATSIPSGNWNIEFFMNVSASSGALASFYVEFYKYNGTTFTLVATNVATPEVLTGTTTIDAYYTSVAFPETALLQTDRLAIRIYANVASKTVTLYTEDNRLCQVVTTFSRGILSLNNLTDQQQYFAVGTSGSDFNIVSSLDTHTFNIPSASATNRGLITTGTQTIAGQKTFNAALIGDAGLRLKNGVATVASGYVGIGSNAQGITLGITNGATSYFHELYFSDTNGYQYTFPNNTGTLALTSDLNAYVPYTGATANVDLGTNNLFASFLYAEGAGGTSNGGLLIKQYSGAITAGVGYTSLFAPINQLGINFGGAYNALIEGTTLSANRTFTLPNITGTLALLEGTQTFLGDKTFDGISNFNTTIFNSLQNNFNYGFQVAKQNTRSTQAGYMTITSVAGTASTLRISDGDSSTNNIFTFDTTGSRTYTFPNITGTIALLQGNQNFIGFKQFSDTNSTWLDYGISMAKGSTPSSLSSSRVNVYSNSGDKNLVIADTFASFAKLQFQATGDLTYTFPASSGTIALTSNLSSYVPYTGATTNVNLGFNLLTTNSINLDGNSASGVLNIKSNSSISTSGAGYVSLVSGNVNQLSFVFNGGNSATFTSVSLSASRTYSLPDASGTISLTSDLSAYVTLATNQTISGQKIFSSITTFSGVTTFNQTVAIANTSSITSTSGFLTLNSSLVGSISSLTLASSSTNVAKFSFNNTAVRTYTLPDSDGTIALTSNLSSYLPLTGGTLTGALSGTSATFSGNVGVGGGVSAWTSGWNVLQVNTATLHNTGSFSQLANNIYFDGTNYRYINTSGATRLGMNTDGEFFIGTAASGSAGSVATMITRLSINGSSGAATFSASNGVVANFVGTSGNYGQIYSDANAAVFGASTTTTLGNNYLYINPTSNFQAFVVNGGERMRITSGGNVGIGTNVPTNLLTLVSSASGKGIDFVNYSNLSEVIGQIDFNQTTDILAIYNKINGLITFGTNNTERMRITSSGDLCIAKTSTAFGTVGHAFLPNGQVSHVADGSVPFFLNRLSADGDIALFYRSSSQVGSISVTTSSTSYNTSSDYRLKQDLKDYEGLSLISKIKTYDYQWKSDNTRSYGVMAHELQEIIPQAVVGEKDGEQMQGVDYSKLVPILIKSIQELEAKIVTLESKLN